MMIFFLAGGICLRVMMWLSAKSLWGDEWFSLALASEALPKVIEGAIRDVHPPLYFVLLHASVNFLGSGEWALRSVSFVSGLGAFFLIVLLSFRYLGKKAALIAAYLGAFSPYWLQCANEMRSYSLLSLVTIAGSVCYFEWQNKPVSKRWVWGLLICAVIAVYTEHYAWFWVMGIGLCVVRTVARSAQGRSIALKPGLVFVLLGIPGLLLIIHQAPTNEAVFDLSRLREYWSLPVMIKKIAGIFWHFSCGYRYSMLSTGQIAETARQDLLFWLSAFCTAIATWVMANGLKHCKKYAPAMFLWGISGLFLPIAFMGTFYAIRLEARYLSFAAPVFFVMAAFGASKLRNGALALFLFLYSVVAGLGAFGAITSSTDPLHKEDYPAAVRYAFARAARGDAIIGLGPQVEYYRKRFGLRTGADYYPDHEAFAEKAVRPYRKIIWIDGTNMHPELARRMYERLSLKMSDRGYVPAEEPVRFGGPEGLVMAFIYKPAKESAVNQELS